MHKRKRSSERLNATSKRAKIVEDATISTEFVLRVFEVPELLNIIASHTKSSSGWFISFHFAMRMLTLVSKSLNKTCKQIYNDGIYESEHITGLKSYASGSGYLSCLKYLHECDPQPCENITADAARNSHMDILRYCADQGLPFTHYTLTSAATSGNMDVLEFIKDKVQHIDLDAFKHSIISGNVDVVKWFGQFVEEITEEELVQAATYGVYDVMVHLCEGYYRLKCDRAAHAAAKSSFKCMKYLMEHGCPYDKRIFCEALKNDDYACIEYLLANRIEFDDRAYYTAAQYGRLRAIKEMRKQRDWSVACESMMELVDFKHMDLVKYMHDEGVDITPNCCIEAASSGILEALRYTIENCSTVMTQQHVNMIFNKAIGSGTYLRNYPVEALECTKYIYERFKPTLLPEHCYEAVKNHDLGVLKYLRSIGCPWDEETSKSAVQHGTLECVTYIFEHGCDLAKDLYKLSIESLKPHVFKYLYTKKYPLSEGVLSMLAQNGYTKLLQMVYKDGILMEDKCCEKAAGSGHFACMKYVHSKGAPWRESCTKAARNGSLDCLKYARENGAKWDEYCAEAAVLGGDLDCFRYVMGNGCPYVLRDLLQIASQRYLMAHSRYDRKVYFAILMDLEAIDEEKSTSHLKKK